MPIIQTTKTYYCGVCDYHIDNIDIYGDYYTTKFQVSSPGGLMLKGIAAGKCAACYAQGQLNDLAIELDTAKMSTHETVEAPDIAALTEVERDSDGNKIKVDSGAVKQDVGIVNGQITVIDTPIFVEKTRELTKEEQQAKLDDANKAIDDLSVKEFDPRQVT